MKKALLVFPVVFLFLFFSTPAFAHNSFEDNFKGRFFQNLFRNFEHKVSTDDGKFKCLGINQRIDARINYLEFKKKVEENRNKRTQDKLNTLRNKANAQNVDTSALSSDLTTLNSKIATLSSDYDVLISKLGELKGKTCPSDDFKNALTQARTLYQKVQTDLKDLRDFYKKLKTDAKNLRSNLPQKTDLQKDSDEGIKDHSALDKLEI